MWLSWGKKQQSSGGAQQTQRLSGQVGGGELAGKDDTTIKLNRSNANPPNTNIISLFLQSFDKQVSPIHLFTPWVSISCPDSWNIGFSASYATKSGYKL